MWDYSGRPSGLDSRMLFCRLLLSWRRIYLIGGEMLQHDIPPAHTTQQNEWQKGGKARKSLSCSACRYCNMLLCFGNQSKWFNCGATGKLSEINNGLKSSWTSTLWESSWENLLEIRKNEKALAAGSAGSFAISDASGCCCCKNTLTVADFL